MSRTQTDVTETIVPSQAETRIARTSSRQMARLLKGRGTTLHVCIRRGKNAAEDVAIPLPALRILADALAQMAEGHAVTILPVDAELFDPAVRAAKY